MDGELFVVGAVESSDRASDAASAQTGLVRSDLLRTISRGGENAARAVATARAGILAAFSPAPPPTAFVLADLTGLARSSQQQVLARALGVRPDQVLAFLFDEGALEVELDSVRAVKPAARDPESLFLHLLGEVERIEVKQGLRSNSWGPYLERRHWLSASARERLEEVARQSGWPRGTRPTRVLAGVLQQQTTTGPPSGAPRFDSMAVVEVKLRVAMVVARLRQGAMENAERAAELLPDMSTVTRLPALLDIYENGAVATGLDRVFTGTTTVQLLLADPVVVPVIGRPAQAGSLDVVNERHFGLLRRKVTFDVTCPIEGQAEPAVVLRCRALPSADLGIVRSLLRRVDVSALSSRGRDTSTRVLNTQVPESHGLRGLLRAALREHGVDTIRCAVLTGAHSPVAVPAPWHEYLRARIPLSAPPAGDTALSSADDVLAELRRRSPGAEEIGGVSSGEAHG